MKKKLLFLTTTLTVPFLFACGLDEVEVKPTESITLNKTEVILNIGEEETLKATALPKEASQEFVWKSSAPNAVNVIGGKITAYALPEVVYTPEEKTHYYDEEKDAYYVAITASNYTKDVKDLKVATCKVFVTNNSSIEDVPAESISISNSRLDFVVGDPAVDLFATVLPTNSKYKNVDWSFVDDDADNEVISITNKIQPNPDSDVYSERVSSKATITPLKEGNATITVKNVVENEGDSVFSATCAVSVTKPEDEIVVSEMSFGETEVHIEQGQEYTNQLNIYPFNAKDKEVTYSSDNEPAVIVNDNGLVRVASNAPIGTEANITATLVSNPSIKATYKVIVDEHHVNYLLINRSSATGWVKEEMHLKDGSETEYVLYDVSLKRGDQFVFYVGEAWHHFSNIKDEGARNDFVDNENDIVAGRSGKYNIYVETNVINPEGDFKSIYFDNVSYDPVTVSMTVYHDGVAGDPISLTKKADSETEYETVQYLDAGDEVIFDISGEIVGYSKVKDGITAPVEQGSENRIRVKHQIFYNFFVETAVSQSGKSIWINSNYIQIGKLVGDDYSWDYFDIDLKPGSETEYQVLNVELDDFDKVVFNVGNGWYHFGNCKFMEENPAWNRIQRDDDDNIVISEGKGAKYDFYIETKDGPKDGENDRPTIWINYFDPTEVTQLTVKDGTPIPLQAKSSTEYKVEGALINKGNEFVGNINGSIYGFEKIKEGASSDLFEEGSLYSEGIHYLKAKETLKYDVYLETADTDQQGFWLSANYIKKCIAGEWTVENIELKNEDPSEFEIKDLALSKGDKFLFRIGNEDWSTYKYGALKSDSPEGLYFKGDEDENFEALASGTYTIYVQTNHELWVDGKSIYIYGSLDSTKFTYEKEGGSPVALEFKPDNKDEFLLDISLAVNEKIRFNIDGGHSTVKESSPEKSKFSAMDANGYLKCTTAGKFRFYVKFIGDDLGIYIAKAPEAFPTYIFSRSQISWNIGGARFYAWAFSESVPGHWYEGTLDENNLVFNNIPGTLTKAVIVRVKNSIPSDHLDEFNGVKINNPEHSDQGGLWNRTPSDISLPGTSGSVSWSLVDWFD